MKFPWPIILLCYILEFFISTNCILDTLFEVIYEWDSRGVSKLWRCYRIVSKIITKCIIRQSNQSIMVEFTLFEILEASVDKSLLKIWKETNAKTSRWSSNHGFLDRFAIASGSSSFIDWPKSNFISWMIGLFGIQKSDKHLKLKFSSPHLKRSKWPLPEVCDHSS